MKVLVTGCTGLLGSNICKQFKELGHTVIGFLHRNTSSSNLDQVHAGDLLTKSTVIRALAYSQPDVVINCVGLTNVDLCEDEPGQAWLTNAESVVELARLTRSMRIRLIHISTDHIFDGKGSNYVETDLPEPVNVYGWSKLGAELSCLSENPYSLIVRTSFYGWAPEGHPPTFADWLYTSLKDKKPINLIKDYYFTALEVSFLVKALDKLLSIPTLDGVIHVASPDRVSKLEFGLEMAKVFGLSTEAVTVVKGQALHAPRPMDSSMCADKFEKIAGYKLEGVKEGLLRLYNTLKETK